MENKNIDWLLSGDPSIVYQTKRDLLQNDEADLTNLQLEIGKEGWGKRFLTFRNDNGHWPGDFYLRKWTCTHYTLLDLKNLGFPKVNEKVNESVNLVLNYKRGGDGGINYSSPNNSDVCINGMILNFGAYFIEKNKNLELVTDFLLHTQMKDGGWNCRYLKGDNHSSVHSTISVLEGLLEYRLAGNTYRLNDIYEAEKRGVEFLLVHHLYKSHQTGQTIHPSLLQLSYPCRWKYDILRALDFLQFAKTPYDPRIEDALSIIYKKQRKDGRWNLQAKHPGAVHFDMEKGGKPSRWNTLRALRVLKHFENEKSNILKSKG